MAARSLVREMNDLLEHFQLPEGMQFLCNGGLVLWPAPFQHEGFRFHYVFGLVRPAGDGCYYILRRVPFGHLVGDYLPESAARVVQRAVAEFLRELADGTAAWVEDGGLLEYNPAPRQPRALRVAEFINWWAIAAAVAGFAFGALCWLFP